MGAGAQWVFLRQLRKRANLSVTALAQQLGLSREHLGKLESGRYDNPGWDTVYTWAEALGISAQLVAFIQAHPEVDDDVADWVARQIIGGHSEEAVMRAIIDRYGRPQ